MNRIDVDQYGDVIDREDGPFVSHEEACAIEADRDIKAANLQLLVEKVLAIEVNRQDNFDPYTVRDAMDLARSLQDKEASGEQV